MNIMNSTAMNFEISIDIVSGKTTPEQAGHCESLWFGNSTNQKRYEHNLPYFG